MSDSRAPSFGPNTPTLGGGMTWRMECDLHDCDVEGTLPTDLDGGFYRVGRISSTRRRRATFRSTAKAM